MGKEKYTIEEIVDAICEGSEEVMTAIHLQDREMLEDVIKQYLV